MFLFNCCFHIHRVSRKPDPYYILAQLYQNKPTEHNFLAEKIMQSLVFVENHLHGYYCNHSIITKQHVLVYHASSTTEFLIIFTDN